MAANDSMTPCPSCEKKDREIAAYKDQNDRIAEMRIEDCERAEKAQATLAAITKQKESDDRLREATYKDFLLRGDEIKALRAKLDESVKALETMPGWYAGEPAESYCTRLAAWHEQTLARFTAADGASQKDGAE